MTRITSLALLFVALAAPLAHAQWAGLTDESAALGTDTFPFFGSHPEAGGNENYYDGDLGDFDGDSLPDRLLGARYGLLFNTGGGRMVPIRRLVGMLLRGDAGASGWGEDAMALVDVDGDGDLDAVQGGNGEPLTCQINENGRFRVGWTMSRSALNIVPTDIDGDDDVDLVVAFAFCNVGCGSGQFSLLLNDGSGTYTEVSNARGIRFVEPDHIVGAASGDIDGDGDFDLVLARGNTSTQSIVVAINDGTGNFTQRNTTLPINCSGFAQALSLGDLDDDGDLDLVVGRCPSEPPSYLAPYTGGHPVVPLVLAMNDGSGNFTDRSATHFDASGRTTEIAGANIALADIDYDGDLDLIIVDAFRGTMPTNDVHIFLNDGTGRLVFSAATSMSFPRRTAMGLGLDADISDLDGDGVYDVWVGAGSDIVRILLNTYTDPSGLPADVPRSVRVVSAGAGGITVGWQNPPFASNVRYYRVYRSLASRVADGDRVLAATVGASRFLDQDFFATIDRHTTTADLGDPAASIATGGEIRWTDASAVPGVRYHYAIAHVGPESDESFHSAEVSGAIVAPGGADTTDPMVEIVSPTADDWWPHPRIVVAYGDGQSGIDPSTLSVTFDSALGPIAAGTNLAPMGYRHDAEAFIAFFDAPNRLPNDANVTMTVSVSDVAGNTTTETVTFFVTVLPSILSSSMRPSASLTAAPMTGTAPVDIAFDATASDDPDGEIIRAEWYFGDGQTGIGRQTSHRYDFGGTYTVTLLVRDTHGNVRTTSSTLTLMGPPPGTDGGVVADGGTAMDGGPACTPDCTGRSCGDDGCGGSCGACSADRVCSAGACLCSGALSECGGACVDVRTDASHCGACDAPCAAAMICTGSTCRDMGTPCTPDCTGRGCGDDGCGGSCGDCGAENICAAGGQCVCSGSGTACGGACVDVRTNASHCGACDAACAGAESCVAGVCTASMTPPEDEGGCDCRAAGRSGREPGGALLLLLFAALALRVTRRL